MCGSVCVSDFEITACNRCRWSGWDLCVSIQEGRYGTGRRRVRHLSKQPQLSGDQCSKIVADERQDPLGHRLQLADQIVIIIQR